MNDVRADLIKTARTRSTYTETMQLRFFPTIHKITNFFFFFAIKHK